MSRQREVLDRLGEMDREAEEMRRELASSTVTRDQLRSRVDQLQTECSLLHNQVSELEVDSVCVCGSSVCMYVCAGEVSGVC